MVGSEFRLDKALAFIIVAILIASPVAFFVSGISFVDTISLLVLYSGAIFVLSTNFVYDIYRIFSLILISKRLDGKYGGSGRWVFSSLSAILSILFLDFFSARVSFSIGGFCV